jgi:hypothetical protein
MSDAVANLDEAPAVATYHEALPPVLQKAAVDQGCLMVYCRSSCPNQVAHRTNQIPRAIEQLGETPATHPVAHHGHHLEL